MKLGITLTCATPMTLFTKEPRLPPRFVPEHIPIIGLSKATNSVLFTWIPCNTLNSLLPFANSFRDSFSQSLLEISRLSRMFTIADDKECRVTQRYFINIELHELRSTIALCNLLYNLMWTWFLNYFKRYMKTTTSTQGQCVPIQLQLQSDL